jgi:hypothetical protein
MVSLRHLPKRDELARHVKKSISLDDLLALLLPDLIKVRHRRTVNS